MNKFTNPLDPENIQIKAAIREWTIAALKINALAEIEISEIHCAEPSCVNVDTYISVKNSVVEANSPLGVGGTEGVAVYKITKPLVYIRKLDISLMQKMERISDQHRH